MHLVDCTLKYLTMHGPMNVKKGNSLRTKARSRNHCCRGKAVASYVLRIMTVCFQPYLFSVLSFVTSEALQY